MDRILCLLAVILCSGEAIFGDLLVSRSSPAEGGAFITIPGLDAKLPTQTGETTRRKSRAEPEVETLWDSFAHESDYIYFPDVPPSAGEEAIADSRKLLIDDGLNEDKTLQELPDGEDSSLLWRLRDLSVLENLDETFFGDQDAEEDFETFKVGSESQSGLQKYHSNVFEVSAQPPGRNIGEKERNKQATTSCGSDEKCAMTLRQKLLRDLASSHSEPLASFIEYRLKRRPSIYVSKRPQTRLDIGIPDIYEMEVEVTPVAVPNMAESPLPSKRKQLFGFNSNETHSHGTHKDLTHHKKFVPVSTSPKFVSLGSLYNSREGAPSEIQPKAPKSHTNWNLNDKSPKHRILSRGKAGIQVNPKADGFRRHLPYRRPISFKHSRTRMNQDDGYTNGQAGNETEELSALEKIAFNKTPGIVIEHPNIFEQKSFMSLLGPYSGFLPDRIKRPMRFRSGKRRQKKRKQTSRLKGHLSQQGYKGDDSHSSTPTTEYEKPKINTEVPRNEYLPSNKPVREKGYGYDIYDSREVKEHGIPIRSQTKPKILRKQPETLYQTPEPSKELHQTLFKHSEPPTRKYKAPEKESYEEAIDYSYSTVAYDSNLEEGSQTRGKGQVPRWLIALKNKKNNPTPPSAYFPEASSVKWTPMDSTRDLGPVFIMPNEKYSSLRTTPLIQTDYKSPTTRTKHTEDYKATSQNYKIPKHDKYEVSTEDSAVKEYLPPDSPYPVLASVTQSTQTKKGNYDSSPTPAEKEYVAPATTYSPPAYTTILSKPNYGKSNSSTHQKSRRPPIIIINEDDDYYDYEDYIDDEYDGYDYYDDEDYEDYEDEDYYYYDDEDYYDDDYVFEILTQGQRPFMPHIVMADLDDILHEVDIMEYGYILGIPGIAGRDYPILQYIPLTTFRCHLVADYPGYYADMEAGCQVFHVCHRSGRQDSFLCPNGTIFNQKYFVCDWWYNFSCEDAAFFYPVNAAIEYQEVPLHEGHLLGGYSFPSSAARKYKRHSSKGKRTRRKSQRKHGKSGQRRRLRRKPYSRQGQRRIKKQS